MKIFIAEDYADMSKQAAKEILNLAKSFSNPFLCPASGDTPTGVYREMISLLSKESADVSQWNFIGLDEWVGLNGDDEGSCRHYLNSKLFNPLRINQDSIFFFDGKANDLTAQCELAETFIRRKGGIDIAILGLGMNGHIGMNEPGTPKEIRSHISNLEKTTQQTGQKYFKKQQELSRGITLGIANLLESRHIILLVSGTHKSEIASKIIEEEVSEKLPATLLRLHPSLKIFLDVEAAGKLLKPINDHD